MSFNISSKQSVNNSESGKFVRLWRLLKFYYEEIFVFIKEYMEQPLETNIPLKVQKAKQSALEMTQATI